MDVSSYYGLHIYTSNNPVQAYFIVHVLCYFSYVLCKNLLEKTQMDVYSCVVFFHSYKQEVPPGCVACIKHPGTERSLLHMSVNLTYLNVLVCLKTVTHISCVSCLTLS